jgi:hypothetical protein
LINNIMKNLNSIASDLFNKLRSRFSTVTIGDENGHVTIEPEQSRFYDFTFEVDNESAGKVSISLDRENGITVIYDRVIPEHASRTVKSQWFDFLRELRQFAKRRLMRFDVRDINKTNLTKRDYRYLAATRSGDNQMKESAMYGTARTSYQRIGNARLAIKHTEPVNTESVASRSQKIDSIFIESPSGERFRYPYRHLSGARAMARHVAEGGTAYDDFGQYISGLSEELNKLRKFKNYVNRSSVMAESLSGYMDIVRDRITTVKKTIESLQKPNHYQQAVDGFEKPVLEQVPDDVKENWIDQLTIRQFNEELQDVFPYIYNLIKEGTRAQSLTPDDLLDHSEVDEGERHGNSKIYDKCWDGYARVPGTTRGEPGSCKKIKEEEQMEDIFNQIMGQFAESMDLAEAMVPPGYMVGRLITKSVSKGQQRIGQNLGTAAAGKNETTIKAIFGHFQDPLELNEKTAEYTYGVFSPDHLVKVVNRMLDSTLHRIDGVIFFFTESEADGKWSEYADALTSENNPKIQVGEREPEEFGGAGGKVTVKNPNKDKKTAQSASTDVTKTAPEKKKTVVFTIENPKLLNFMKKKQPDYMARYYKPLTKEFVMSEKVFDDFKKTIKGEKWVKRFGETMIMVNQAKSFKESQTASSSTVPLGEFILSYFDRETGKFPKGETAVLTAVEKDYGDHYVEPAKQFIERVQTTTLQYLKQDTHSEADHIKRLAGL